MHQRILNNAYQPQANSVAGVIGHNFQEINGVNYRRHPRSVRMAIAAVLDAIEMANFKNFQPHRIAVIMGTSAGAILEIEKYAADGFDLRKFPIHGVALVDTHTLSSSVAEAIGSCGSAFTVTTGCSASLDAILIGKQLLESGSVDACIVEGTEAPLGQWTINGFKK